MEEKKTPETDELWKSMTKAGFSDESEKPPPDRTDTLQKISLSLEEYQKHRDREAARAGFQPEPVKE